MRLTLLQLLIKGFPEGFLSVLIIYFISHTKFNKIKFVMVSLVYIF